jgi:hypothetical protein
MTPDLTADRAAARALAIDPEQLRDTAADARALAIEALVSATSPSQAARRLGVTASAVTKARARAREIDEANDRTARRRRASILVRQLGL